MEASRHAPGPDGGRPARLGPAQPAAPLATAPSRRPGSTSPRRSGRTAGSPARPAATRPGGAGARSPTSPTTPRRSRSRTSGTTPAAAHARTGFRPSISWSPRTTTGSCRPLTRTSSTSSSNSRPDMIGNTARGRASPDDPACRVETTTTRVELRRTTRPAGSGLMTRSSRASWTTPRCFLRGRSDRPSRATRQPRSGSSFARTTWLAGSTIPQSRCWLRPAGTRGEGGVEWSIHVSSLRIEELVETRSAPQLLSSRPARG